jgi:hypothetical protein
MPKRYIVVPPDVFLVDPETKAPLPGSDGAQQTITFSSFLQRLMNNPMWIENYANMRSQAAILDALKEKSWSGEKSLMELAEEDWLKLKNAAEFPKVEYVTTAGRQIVPGYGFHPTLSAQLLPLVEAIVSAGVSRPIEEKAV